MEQADDTVITENELGIGEERLSEVKHNRKERRRGQKRRKDVPASVAEVSKNVPKSGGDHSASSQAFSKPPKPNYFVAIQVTNPEVLENALRIQEGIMSNATEDLKHLMVDVKKSHLTLMVMHLEDDEAVKSAIECLETCLPLIQERVSSVPEPPVLEFEGLSAFGGGSVVFASVKPSPSLTMLHSVADVVSSGMKEYGILATGKAFNPHMTLMKYQWKKGTRNCAKRVEKHIYVEFEKDYFGCQPISSIQLCQMQSVQSDGYYIVDHQVFI